MNALKTMVGANVMGAFLRNLFAQLVVTISMGHMLVIVVKATS